jgi:hypothetical protein
MFDIIYEMDVDVFRRLSYFTGVFCDCGTQYYETIHPGTKEVTLQKGQEPTPSHRRSEGPYHNLEIIVSTHQQKLT